MTLTPPRALVALVAVVALVLAACAAPAATPAAAPVPIYGPPPPPSSASNSTAPNPSGPRLLVEKDAVDFGLVPLGKMVDQSFVVKNQGSAPLVLSDVKLRVEEGC